MVIVENDGIGKPSLNFRRDCFRFSLFSSATNLEEGKILI